MATQGKFGIWPNVLMLFSRLIKSDILTEPEKRGCGDVYELSKPNFNIFLEIPKQAYKEYLPCVYLIPQLIWKA